jgi:hypothetical protein
LANSNHGASEREQTSQTERFQAGTCVEAARDMIRHVHELFTLAPSLRRWTYYCFYCLQATLVLLASITGDRPEYHLQSGFSSKSTPTDLPASGSPIKCTQEDDTRLCEMAVEIFRNIELKASRQCAEHVHRFLETWKLKNMSRASQISSVSYRAAEQRLGGECDEAAHLSCIRSATDDPPTAVVQPLNRSQPVNTAVPPVGYLPSPHPVHSSSDDSTRPFPDNTTSMAHPVACGSVELVNHTDETSPMSLGGLQADLYDALYCGDQNPQYNFMVDSRWYIPGVQSSFHQRDFDLTENLDTELGWFPERI